jgi:hypothetical protein
METANILLNVGGDGTTIVPKENVTPAEVAVLRVLHGDDSVTDIQVLEGEAVNEFGKARTHRQEIARLTEVYGKNQPEGGRSAPAVQTLFPGAAARVFESFEELELDESAFKPTERDSEKPSTKKAAAAQTTDEGGDGLDKQTVTDLKTLADTENVDLDGATKKADIIAKIRASREMTAVDQDGEGDSDGIEDMNDRQSGSVFE